ncbi:MAG: PKD domain-containing protein [Chitinophagales bacterium]
MRILFTLFLTISLALVSHAQCNLVVNPTEVCGGEGITAYFSSTSNNYTYRVLVSSPHISGPFTGDSITIYPPGSGSQYVVNLTPQRKGPVGNFISCGTPRQVIVKPTPNAELDILSGSVNTNGIITNCNGTVANPNFNLQIGNASTTTATNTQYIINWGDGSPAVTTANFTTLDHTYGLGLYTLSFTVHGAGNAECTPTTTTYQIFNGSSPSVGLEDPFNFIGSPNLCPPVLASFNIVNTGQNVTGTVYEIYIAGELVETFNHPPPATFDYEFTETSCGKTASNGVNNTYDVMIQASSPCPAPPDFATLGPIIIGDTVKPDFIYNPDPVCINEVITFTNTTQGTLDALTCSFISNVKWEIEPATGWTLVSGNMNGAYQIQVQFDDPANYEVTITAANSCDTLEKTKTIDVNELPVADAVAVIDDVNGCAPTVATFTNLSTQDSSVTYNWAVSPSAGVNFLNGTSASSFEPEIQFNNDGQYTVTLTVSNACGSPQWDTAFDISAKVLFEIPALGNVCADTFIYDQSFAYNGNSDSVVWTFTGGNPATYTGADPPPVVFIGSGNYTISASAYNICGVTTKTQSFNLSEPVDIDAGNDIQLCFNDAPVTLVGSPANGVWTGEGVTGTNVFNPALVAQSNVILTYTYDNGICFFTDSINASIISVNNLSAGDDQTTCINNDELILTGNTPSGGSWIGDAVSNSATGIFDPSLSQIGLNAVGYTYAEPVLGCRDTVFKNVEVLDIPVINFDLPDTACVNESISFSLSVDPSATVNWTFGDGSSLAGESVEHGYTSAGIFTVTAEITQSGCVVSDSISIQVITVPTSDYTIDVPNGCNALQVSFTNTSVGHIENVYWDLGNGQNSSATNPQNITYPPGTFFDTTYYVTLTSFNQCGEHSVTDSILVSKAPEARFGTNFNQYCQEDSVLIHNVSYNSPTSYFWDFGNGKTSNSKDPKPQYYETSFSDTTYTITLYASNVCGTDTAKKDIIVRSVDVRSFFNIDHISGCEPLDVTLINFSSVGAQPFWDLGDGNTSLADTVLHTFEDAGMYTIQLAVDNGCSEDTSNIQIEVYSSPEANFSLPDRACEETSVQFTNQSQGGVAYSWNFDDGNLSDLQNPQHIFTDYGVYNVALTAIGGNLCENVVSKSIDILEKPIAQFDTDENRICEHSSIQFINLSTGENFEWDFGNGKKSYVENPINVYTEQGTYDVTLITNIDQFCFDTIVKQDVIEVFGTPTADFEYSQNETEILEGIVSFNNLSIDATDFLWNFGDDDFSYEAFNPTHQYVHSGPYSVLLIAENDFGCIDSIIKPIMVEFFGKLFVPNALSPVLGDISEASMFKPKGVALMEYEMEIYSTYGELLFRTDKLEDGQPVEGWDGTYKGKDMPQDNYIWKIKAMFDNGFSWGGNENNSSETTKEVHTMGTLVLIR